MNDESLSDIQRVNPYPKDGASSPRPLKGQAALYEEITMATERTGAPNGAVGVRSKRVRMPVVAAVAVAGLALGGFVYAVSSPDETLNADSASQPTPTEGSTSGTGKAICGPGLPDAIELFPEEDPEAVTETQTIDGDGRLVHEASFEETTVTVSWPAIERLSEREPAPSWPQNYGVSDGGLDASEEKRQAGTLILQNGMPAMHEGKPLKDLGETQEALELWWKGLLDVVPSGFPSEGECATLSTFATYEGERGQTFAYDFDASSGVEMVSVQPLIRTTVEVEDPPVLDKSSHNGCTGELRPLDGYSDASVREVENTPAGAPVKALETALAVTGFRDKNNFTEIQLSETSVIYAVGENDNLTGEPLNGDTYYMAVHVEAQADGWLATDIEFASGC